MSPHVNAAEGEAVADPAILTAPSQIDLNRGAAQLRAMPVVKRVPPLHPLRILLEERDVGIAEGARLLGVSERSLRAVLTWKARFPWRKAEALARALGRVAEELFPELPEPPR